MLSPSHSKASRKLPVLGGLPRRFLPWIPSLAALCVAATPELAAAQNIILAPGQPQVLRSSSGQFIVKKNLLPEPKGPLAPFATNPAFIRLEPSLLAVSSERIRQSLASDLELGSDWRGKIFLTVFAAASTNDLVLISSEKFRDGWQYRVALPQVLPRRKYVTALLQVILLEFANRNAQGKSAEIPPWVSEGLSRELLSRRETRIFLPVPSTDVNGLRIDAVSKAWLESPLEDTHKQLAGVEPVTFHQLSWPQGSQLEGEQGEIYRACAQLFLRELLQLKDGRAMMRLFLSGLPQFLNWQLAFLRAYQPVFSRPLDVEKWWALQVTCFTGRDLAQTWGREESWRQLNDALRVPVRMRSGPNDLGIGAETTFQTILRDWPAADRQETFKKKLTDLDALRLRLVPEFVPLVDAYREVLRNYLAATANANQRIAGLFLRQVDTREFIQALDNLDERRRTGIPNPAPSGVAAINGTSAGIGR